MALVVEDGTIVPNANSYADLSTIRAYSLARGVDLSAVPDADLEVPAIKAMDYLEASDQTRRYQGDRVDIGQELSFPRSGVYVDGMALPADEVPRYAVHAQCALTMEIYAGADALPSRTGGQVVKEKLGDLEVQYSEKGPDPFTPAFGTVDALLSNLFKRNGLELVRA